MVRFGNTSSEKRNPVSHKLRVKLWMLLGMLAIVGLLMQHLQKPKTAEQLGRLFQLKQQAAPAAPGIRLEDSAGADARLPVASTPATVAKTEGAKAQEGAEAHPQQTSTKQDSPANEPSAESGSANLATLLKKVKDNSVFLDAETPAWLALMKLAQASTPAELAAQSVGQMAYAQLVEQPRVYRGKVVTLRGTILREETLKPTANTLGIESYHRLVMRPAGGGDLPFVIYALTLPKEFPRGDGIRVRATVQGYFFKNWSYAHERGLSLAPVVVTPGIDWQPSATPEQRNQVSTSPARFWQGAAAMAVIAVLVAAWIAHATRRKPPARGTAEAATLESLKRLSNEEASS